MGSLVLGVAGGVIGNMILPGIGGQIGYGLGSMLGGALFSETQKYEGPRLNNLSVQSNTVGLAKGRGYGTIRTAGNIIWTSGYTEHKHTESQGGKGGPKAESTTYTYSINAAIAFNDGEIKAVRRVWANKKLILDYSDTNTGITGSYEQYIRFHNGSENQEVDSLIEQYQGAYTPAFNGTAYMVIENFPLEEFGNQLPQFEFEIICTNILATNGDINVFSIPDTFNTDMVFYENTGDNKLYLIHNFKLYKINQNTMTVEASMTFPIQSSSPVLDYTEFMANDSIGNLYFTSPNVSGNQFTLGIINTVSMTLTYYNNTTAGSNIFNFPNATNSIVLSGNTFIGLGTDAASNDSIYVRTFNSSGGTGNTFTLTQSNFSLGNVRVSCFSTLANKFIFSSWLNNDTTKPILNFASMSGLQENVIQLFNDVDSHYIIDIREDKLRNKILVYSSTTNSSIDSKVHVQVLSYTNGVLTLDKTILINLGGTTRLNNIPLFNPQANKYIVPLYQNSSKLEINVSTSNFEYLPYTTNSQSVLSINNYRNIYSSYLLSNIFGMTDIDTNNINFGVEFGNRYQYGAIQLSSIVSDICEEAGLDSANYDVSDLINVSVRGFKIDTQMTARQILETLAMYFNFDAIESNGKIKFILRGKDKVASINYQEIGAKLNVIDYDSSNIFSSTRTQESELYKKISILYYDIQKDYEQGVQEAQRVINTTDNITTIQSPIVFNSNEAKQIVDRILYQQYVSRDKYQFELNYDYAHLEPTDVIELVKDSVIYSLRITKIDKSQGILKVEAEAEQKTVYSQNGVGSAGVISQDVVSFYANTYPYILDIPIFDLSDNNGGNYVVVDKDSVGLWRGAVLYKSNSQNGDYSAQETFITSTITGIITNNLDIWNQTNTIDYYSNFIISTTGELSTISEEQLINGGNLCCIGGELLQFKNAELIGTNQYKITGLLRGRFGTEGMAVHSNGEKFILFNFDNGSLKRINKSDYIYGVERFYKGTTLRTSIDNTSVQTFTNNAIGLKPYSVINVIGTRNGIGDLYVSFNKRIRGQLIWNNTLDSVDPDGDYYDIDIYNGVSIVRTIYTTSLNFTYTALQQIEDFGSLQNNVSFKIYKVNNGYGRGFEKAIIL